MGRYVPPDASGLVTSGNALHKKHPLGARASKLASHGILVVRFEMPFAVWCASCPKPTLISQGVRFNAEKKKVGNYLSSTIWGFRLKHGDCGGWIEMRTDPRAGEFVVVSGGRKRDHGGEAEDESLVKMGASGGVVIQTEREKAEQRESAFGRLERTIADRERMFEAGKRIGELQDVAERQWEDPYAQNQRLRKAFRVGRHEREREAEKAGELKERMGLGIELLPEAEEDARRAALVDFGGIGEGEGDVRVEKALASPLFEKEKEKKDENHKGKGLRKLKSEIAASRTRDALVSEIISNTRASRDPFLDFGSKDSTPKGPTRLPGLKRKRAADETPDTPSFATDERKTPKALAGTTALVSYDSDSD